MEIIFKQTTYYLCKKKKKSLEIYFKSHSKRLSIIEANFTILKEFINYIVY